MTPLLFYKRFKEIFCLWIARGSEVYISSLLFCYLFKMNDKMRNLGTETCASNTKCFENMYIEVCFDNM